MLSPRVIAQRSNPESFRGGILDCFAALAMTVKRQTALLCSSFDDVFYIIVHAKNITYNP